MLSASSSNRVCSRHQQRQINGPAVRSRTFVEEIRSVAPRLSPFDRKQGRFNARG
jgi:hypothetical protein